MTSDRQRTRTYTEFPLKISECKQCVGSAYIVFSDYTGSLLTVREPAVLLFDGNPLSLYSGTGGTPQKMRVKRKEAFITFCPLSDPLFV
ncbi:hypothetical protein SRHO_G00253450 [Serrasalmus rhombeus]